jgi:ribose transport system substrate-binding protein
MDRARAAWGRNSNRALGLLLLGLVVVLTACGGDEAPAPGGEATEGGGGSIVVLSCPDSNTFCAAYNNTARTMAEEAGYEVTILTDNFDPSVQAQHMDQAIAQRPDAILEVPVDSHAIVASLRRAHAAGIPVINGIHRLAEEGYEYVEHSVEADTHALGQAAAENIVAGLEERGVEEANIIAITGSSSQFTVVDRLEGFESVLENHPEYKLVEVEDGNWEDERTASLARQLFAKYGAQGGIDAAYGMADNQANAIIQAAQQAGLPVGVEKDGLIVVGTSCQPVTIENMRAGSQYGSATNSPILEAQANMQATLDFLAGKEMPKVIQAPEAKITQENLDEFLDVCDF